MSKKSVKKKTAEQKQKEFSEAVEQKSKQIEKNEKKRKEFSKAVEEKSKEIAVAEEKRKQFRKTVEEKNKELKDPKPQEKSGEKIDVSADDVAKATLRRSEIVKYVLIIAIVGGVSVAGLVMCVLNIMRANWFFAVDYLIAAILGASIVIVKINTLFPTFVACDGKRVIMRAYENRVAPYNISHKLAFLCDFIPAKTTIVTIDAKKITSVFIGTKNYIKRHCGESSSFLTEIEAIEKSNIGKNMLLAMDMIYFDCGGSGEFMSIDKFDTENIAAVVRRCIKANPDVEVMCNNKFLRNKILFDLPSK